MRPHPSDKASHARIQYFRFDEYPDRWRELWDVFSREAVWSGAFDQYAASKRKRGTSEVDVDFLKDMEGWRLALAGNIALRNKDLSLDDLNAAVQLTIDRVVFLRMAEDRGLEPYEQLLKLCERPDIYPRFMHDLCRQADEKYNSGLFHFLKESGVSEDPDRITPKLAVDDKVFKPILESLYFAYGSPYHFGLLPVEILGTVYERFLGKVIRLTAGHQAKVEPKPEVRKAGGVYYTPAYIVEYIVKHTVGRQIEGRSPAQLAGEKGKPPFRVLDMACGSGSFLLGAYQRLLDHFLNWYIEHKPENFKKAVYKDPRNGHWRLTIEEKKRILTTHIFGVDIDLQAVEVTKLSLLLKVLEGETDQSFSLSQLAFGDRALPNLADNIKCGNSLIGSDYFMGKLFADPDKEMKLVKPFDWKQGFPDAMDAGGFDCVVGNPPWVFTRDVDFGQIAKEYFADHFVGAEGKVNLYALFLDRGIETLRKDGLLSMILPNTFLRATTYEKLRRHLITRHRLVAVTDAGTHVFEGVTASTVVLLIQKDAKASAVTVFSLSKDGVAQKINTVDTKQIAETPSAVVDIFTDTNSRQIILKMDARARPLAELVKHLISGIQTWKQHKSNFISNRRVTDKHKPLLEGKDIGRYESHFANKYIFYSAKVLNVMQDENIFLLPDKILIQRISGGSRPLKATLDSKRHYCFNSINTLVCRRVDNRYVLGLLNSTLLSWYYYNRFSNRSELTVNIATRLLRQLPIPALDLSDAADKSRHDRIVTLVNSMLGLHKQLTAAKSAAHKAIMQRQIDATDAEIDRLVYDLYGINEEERKIIEESMGARRG
jgi:type I restriction-modification system DNA methylase subunit